MLVKEENMLEEKIDTSPKHIKKVVVAEDESSDETLSFLHRDTNSPALIELSSHGWAAEMCPFSGIT